MKLFPYEILKKIDIKERKMSYACHDVCDRLTTHCGQNLK